MKKAIFVFAFVLLLCLVGCGHTHEWKEATCEEPKTCSICGYTEGAPLGHDWKDATCAEPKTCSRCGAKEGDPAGHDFQLERTEAVTCTKSGYSVYACTRCGTTDVRDKISALGHDWKDATCTEPKTCARCGRAEGSPVGHKLPDQICTEPGVCPVCGEELASLGHDWKDATCTEPKTCARCGLTEGEALGHTPGEPEKKNEKSATCTAPGSYDEVVYCSVCRAELSRETVEVEPLGHTTNNGTCSRCGEEIKEPIVFAGTGNKVISDISVPQGVYKVTMKNSGSRNFFVIPYNKSGDRLSSFAIETGRYDGSVFFADDIDGGLLEVTSSGDWSISFEQIPGSGTSNVSGYGDWVSPWFELKEGALVVTMENDGERNFFVTVYDETGRRYSSLAIETGPFSGQTVFNQGRTGTRYCIEVTSSGNWTVDFGLGDPVTER